MIWLIIYNWFQLLVAFVLGVAAARWVMGPRAAGEDLMAQLAAERTKRQEAEAAKSRERARVAELDAQVRELQRRARLHAPSAETPDTSQIVVSVEGRDHKIGGGHAPNGDDGAPSSDEETTAALRRINGVGPQLARRLMEHGVTSIADIAAWTEDDAVAFDRRLNAAGAILRQDWVGQARRFAAEDADRDTERNVSTG